MQCLKHCGLAFLTRFGSIIIRSWGPWKMRPSSCCFHPSFFTLWNYFSLWVPLRIPLAQHLQTNNFKKTCKTKRPPLPSVMDSQPKTQRSGREKTKCEYTISTPNYSNGIGWKWRKRERSQPFIYKTLISPPIAVSHGRVGATRIHARPCRCGFYCTRGQ